MPRKQKNRGAQAEQDYMIRFHPVLENEYDASARREQIQSCLVQMLLRASKPGKQSKEGNSFGMAA